MSENPDPGKTYQREIYRYVEDITEGLMDTAQEDISQQLEQQYGLNFYPIDKDFESGNKYMRASFGLSGLLSRKYSRPNDTFFDNREETFREFIEELGRFGTGYEKTHLIQYAQLYSEIADIEDIEFDHPVETLVLQDLDEARGTVREMFDDLAEKF
ncbi:hypothetical protein ACK3SF_01545 [Candidatus Nanosalina sp. VS9-1]|uniref:hypothetical protein n=1 Tax=Candidatus Nanosalina sp. VS9-1 TaxID=3388566 RepID=UPI0039DF33E0